MRSFEALYLAGLVAALIFHAWDPRRQWFIPLLLGILLIAHLGLDGWRWQLAPAYALGLLIFVGVPTVLAGPITRTVIAALGCGLVAVSAALCLIWPVFELPAPTGTYPVGTATRNIDGFPVLFWYPAVPGSGGAPYLPPGWGMRSRTWHLVRTAATPDAALAPAPHPFPLVVYAPWWGGTRRDGTITCIDLASHGFIVAAIDDVFWDGKPSATANQGPLPPYDFSSDTAAARTLALGGTRVGQEAHKMIRVIDGLAADHGPFPAAQIDLAHVGALGFSFGGASAAEASVLDPRIAAAVNMDGTLYGKVVTKGIDRPFLQVSSLYVPPNPANLSSTSPELRYDTFYDLRDERQQALQIAEKGAATLTIKGVEHVNFSDMALESPLRSLTQAGPIDPKRALAIVDAYVVDFFRLHLLGIPSTLLHSGPSPYPEARLLIRGSAS